MLRDAILLVLLAQGPHTTDLDEGEASRRARLDAVASAIAEASERYADPPRVAAALLVIGRRESHWARYVGEGRCSEGPVGMRCDPDKKGVARARTYWQLWSKACAPAWEASPGSREELSAAAKCAAGLWVGASQRCQDAPDGAIAGAFAGYRSGCLWKGGKPRAQEWAIVKGRL